MLKNTMPLYSVLPFSSASYQKNFRKLGDSEVGCAICGKAVTAPYKNSAVVVYGGDWASTQEEAADESDPGYMGVWGIGPDCHKKFLVK